MTADEPSGLERLELADWRRRVADLYASVRAEAEDDPEAAWEVWREERERLFRTHSQSPVPAAQRSAFRARHWPYDERLRFEVALKPGEALAAAEPGLDAGGFDGFGGLTLGLPISTGGEESFTRIGRLAIPFRGGERSLGAYWMAGYAGGVFAPFRDATNGAETYGAGRYLLDTAKSADLGAGVAPYSLVLDFNFAFHPSCAFDPRWSCPLAPPENRLDIRIEAGERLS
ncbi:MAG TPA: DUF1684 domain-containing protein [Candidatus Binatus sp.]|nr:DUF1684 domain-containing protein [Candidatus Dormibacteraeota bacterium]HYL41039.1 DUF1684 domain-containing protein [Candidatus Binatus sp.]